MSGNNASKPWWWPFNFKNCVCALCNCTYVGLVTDLLADPTDKGESGSVWGVDAVGKAGRRIFCGQGAWLSTVGAGSRVDLLHPNRWRFLSISNHLESVCPFFLYDQSLTSTKEMLVKMAGFYKSGSRFKSILTLCEACSMDANYWPSNSLSLCVCSFP